MLDSRRGVRSSRLLADLTSSVSRSPLSSLLRRTLSFPPLVALHPSTSLFTCALPFVFLSCNVPALDRLASQLSRRGDLSTRARSRSPRPSCRAFISGLRSCQMSGNSTRSCTRGGTASRSSTPRASSRAPRRLLVLLSRCQHQSVLICQAQPHLQDRHGELRALALVRVVLERHQSPSSAHGLGRGDETAGTGQGLKAGCGGPCGAAACGPSLFEPHR